ncbi:MAG: hypothetical protein ABI894_07605 [Ilumatobacteraceae bacterium]
MNRRRSAVFVAALALTAMPSCATFNRNDSAAKVGDLSLSAKDAQKLAAADNDAATGDRLRVELTKWIRVTVFEASTGTPAPETALTPAGLDARLSQAILSMAGDQAKATYELGVGGSPVLCLAAITAASPEDANTALATINSGMPFADAARQFSTDTVIAADGGIVKGPDGSECLDPTTVNTAAVTALQGVPVGQPIVANLGTFSAVLMMRPYDELSPESQSLIATATVSQDQLDEMVSGSDIYVDPRYGRWDPETGTVVTLTS